MEVVRVEDCELPARTALARLQPCGLGTMFVESLSSYFQRLADLHSVSPKLLAREFVLPKLGFNNRVGEVQADRYWRASFFNGIGEVPQRWCRVLEDLTGMAGLQRLTLVPLQGLTSLYGSASATRRWCPCCLSESEEEGQPYGQLLWEIGCVKACPKHGTLLVSKHGCREDEGIPPLLIKPLPQICWACGRSLTLHPGEILQPADEADLALAQAVGELLASPVFDNSPREVGRTIGDFLSDVIRSHEGGNGNRAVRKIGVNKADVSGWVHRKHLPSLPQAAMIAGAYGVPLHEALVGRGSDRLLPDPWAKAGARPSFKTKRFKKNTVWNVEEKLREVLQMEIPLAESAAADLVGRPPRSIRAEYPELCHAIAQRHAEWVANEANLQRDERLHVVETMVDQMICEGEIPTFRKLQERLVGVPKAFLFKEREACKRISEKARAVSGL